jgi:haloalkane dehalogenase
MANNWLNQREYPFTAHYFNINGQQLHYIDEGQGEILLFVHGTPSWSFDFRNVIKALRTNYRCIAIDHIGFGLSDKPQTYNYSTPNHSQTLTAFILQLQLKDITLVVHDFGGPIGLAFGISYPHLIKRQIIFNSWLWSSQNEPDFVRLKRVLKSPLLPFLYRYLNFSARFILPGSFGEHKLPAPILKQYTSPFANSKQRKGTLAFAYSLLNDQHWFEELWNKKKTICDKPTLFIWGMKDPVLKPHYLKKFQSGFNRCTTVEMRGSGHFPQEEEPALVSQAIKTFLQLPENR